MLNNDLTAAQAKALKLNILRDVIAYASLIKRYISSEDDEVDCIYTVQELCEAEEASGSGGVRVLTPLFAFVLQKMYDNDVISEQAVLEWADEETPNSAFVKRADKFLTWLREASEDSDE